MKVRQTKHRLGAWLLSLVIFSSCLGILGDLSSIFATEAGHTESFRFDGPTYIWTKSGGIEGHSTKIVKVSDGKAVFCVEPFRGVNTAGEYVAYDADSVELSGYFPAMDEQYWENKVLTPEERHHTALWVYHGWDQSETKDYDDYMAVQLHLWEYIWGFEATSITNNETIRALQEEIAAKVAGHNSGPVFSGDGYDPGSNTLTLRSGTAVRLRDSNGVLAGATLQVNTTGMTAAISGDELALTAADEAVSGKLVFCKYPNISEEATSIIYSDGGEGQKVGEFKIADPGKFELNVSVIANGAIRFRKTAGTERPLDGGVFELQDASGNAVPLSAVTEGHYEAAEDAGETRFTTVNGEVLISGLKAGRYTIREITAPAGFGAVTSEVAAEVRPGETSEAVLDNQALTGSVRIQKYDVERGTETIREGSLEGARYAIAVVDLINPAASALRPGDVAEILTTDELGKAVSGPLPLGTYDLIEQSPSEGYLLNETAVRFMLQAGENGVKVSQLSANGEPLIAEINANISAFNRLLEENHADRPLLRPIAEAKVTADADLFTAERSLMGRIEINKNLQTPAGNGEVLSEPEEGIVFTVTNMFGEKVDELKTNKKGWATSVWLPYGRYRVEQKTMQSNAYPAEGFDVVIDKDWNRYLYQLTNEAVTAKLRIVKKDALSGRPIPQSGVTFELYTEDGNKVVQHIYAPEYTELSQFVTGADGTVMLPEPLPAGTYTLKEVQSPRGYVLPGEGDEIKFTVDREMAESLQDLTLTLEVTNEPVFGQIIIRKTGSVPLRWEHEKRTFVLYEASEDGRAYTEKETSIEVFKPWKEVSLLAGAVFEIRAAEDIVNADGTAAYAAGELVERLTTSGDRETVSKVLPLGVYEVKEIEAPEGYALDPEPRTVTLTQKEPRLALVQESVSVENSLREASADLRKEFEESPYFGTYEFEKVRDSVVFGIFNKEPIDLNGDILPADSCLGISKLDQDNKARFTGLLPNEKYYIRELATARQYEINTESFEVDFQEGETTNFELAEPVRNKLKKHAFVLTKVDSEDPEARLSGASFKLVAVTAAGEVEIGTFTTGEDGSFRVDNLDAGSYYLTEVKAPDGYYLSSEKIPVSLDGLNTLVSGSASNKPNRVRVNKVEKGSAKALPGARMQILTEARELVYEWISDGQPKLLEGLLVGGRTYILREAEAPAGFVRAEDITFTMPVSEPDAEVTYTVENDRSRVEIRKTDIGGREIAGAALEVLDAAGQTADRWVSEEGKAHVILGLKLGETYTLRETAAPAGYVKAEEQAFTVNRDGSVTKVTLVNEKTAARILKVDEEGRKIAGAKLEVLDTDETLIDSWTSEAGEGHVIRGLLFGKTYILREKTAPEGYVPADDVTFTLREDAEVTEVLMVNTLSETAIFKKDIAGSEIPGAKLQVIDREGRVTDSWISEAGRPHIIRGLKLGETYILREELAPEGFVLAQEVPFTVNEDGTVTRVELVNEMSSVEVRKTDISGQEIAGAMLEVLDKDGRIVDSWTSRADAPHVIRGLRFGQTYTLRETQAPEGYVLSREVVFTLNSDGTVTHVNMVNELSTVEIRKTDIAGREIPGAELQVLDAEGLVADSWTSEAGKAHVIRGLKLGHTYTLRETLAPKGYARKGEVQFKVNEDGSVTKVRLINELTVTEIRKTDIAGKEIPGAKLEVLTQEGSVIDAWVSEEDEAHRIEGLEGGKTYILRETEAPDGYLKADDIVFSVSEEGAITKVAMVNRLEPKLPRTGEVTYVIPMLFGVGALTMALLAWRKRLANTQ